MGGTSIPGGQASVRVYQGALPGLGQEHRTADDAICTVESVSGEKIVAERWRVSAPDREGNLRNRVNNSEKGI